MSDLTYSLHAGVCLYHARKNKGEQNEMSVSAAGAVAGVSGITCTLPEYTVT